MIRVALTFNEKHHLHDSLLNGYPCPENPDRLDNILEYLQKKNIIDGNHCCLHNAEPADYKDLVRVHTPEYIDFLIACTKNSQLSPGKDVFVCPDSFEVASHAAGCAIKAGDLVVNGKCTHSFALIRPPGHHAGPETSSGFCLFNNSGILVKYLQEIHGIDRVAIINIDAHASDGTYKVFEADPTVLCVSIHQDQSTLYPFKGFIRDIGARPGLGYCINMEMPMEASTPEYEIFYDEVLEKVLDKYDPQLIVIECGFDAYYKESLAQLNLTVDGYYRIIFKLASKWNIVTLLEGGYHEDLGLLTSVVLNALLGEENTEDDIDMMTLLASRHVKTRKAFNDNLARLKMRLNSSWGLWDHL